MLLKYDIIDKQDGVSSLVLNLLATNINVQNPGIVMLGSSSKVVPQ